MKSKNDMKVFKITVRILLFLFVLVECGCEPASVNSQPKYKGDRSFNVSVYNDYAPARVAILPLTCFLSDSGGEEFSQIEVYVSLLDSSGSQIKWPGVFRFELYEEVVRSAEPKGRRVFIWPDIDLTEQSKNDNCWRDFLRAYKFDLDFETQPKQSYILEVTYICSNGKRLTADLALKT